MPRYVTPWSRLEYPSGHIHTTIASGFTKIHVFCVGRTLAGDRCWHTAILPLSTLPDAPWPAICRRLWCTSCDCVGHVGVRVNWGEVVDFSRSSLGNGQRY